MQAADKRTDRPRPTATQSRALPAKGAEAVIAGATRCVAHSFLAGGRGALVRALRADVEHSRRRQTVGDRLRDDVAQGQSFALRDETR